MLSVYRDPHQENESLMSNARLLLGGKYPAIGLLGNIILKMGLGLSQTMAIATEQAEEKRSCWTS